MNRPEALGRCLDAILTGTLMPAEILVIDQGDTSAAEIVRRRRETTTVSIIHLRQRRRGLSAARNAMLACAHSELLAITDDDCVPHPEWLAAVARSFASTPVPAAVAGRVLALGPERPGTYAVSLRTGTERTDFVGDTVPWIVGTGANFTIRRQWILRAGGYDERLGAGSPGMAAEDLELMHRLLKAGARIRYEPDAVVYHERQPEARRMSTRWAYGHGIGATCGILFRRGDRYAVSVCARWLAGRIKRLAAGAVRRDPRAVRQAWLSVAGTLRGVIYGWRVEGKRT